MCFEADLEYQCLQLLRQHELAGEVLLAVADHESDEVPHAVSSDGRGGYHREILLEVHFLPEQGHIQTLEGGGRREEGKGGREGGREEGGGKGREGGRERGESVFGTR